MSRFSYIWISLPACSALRKAPVLPMNFIAFHWMGLWDAVMASPPSAFKLGTENCTVGVATTPKSTTLQPDARSPATTASRIIIPDPLASRPMMTFPAPQ
jgi:hypothetical protein